MVQEELKQVCGRQWLKMVIYMLPDPLLYVTHIRKDPYFYYIEKTPASIGVWMGILMIDEYMKKHPDLTIKDLLAKIIIRCWLKQISQTSIF